MSISQDIIPELLAPAGSLEVFEAAVAAGADAIYIGAPQFNARNLAKHFSVAEVAAMLDYGHANGVKVYLAANSLVRQDELAEACDMLAMCDALKPDALIIQDLGLYHLARTHFPDLELHASTLMLTHNHYGVQQAAKMGFPRVVLAREMTIREIARACKVGPEIEVFVHGALCFSYSGLCLYSSYLGGRSGLRGRCVQPCRRLYSHTDMDGKNRDKKEKGYDFSMNDLSGIEMVPDLVQAGVASLKIEGRMRSIHYVSSVVQAYRLALDHVDDLAEVLPECQALIASSMGRTPTGGYFAGANPADALAPTQSGNIGLFLGRVGKHGKGTVQVKLKEDVVVGDRLRIHLERSGERVSFTLKNMQDRNGAASSALKGWKVTLDVGDAEINLGDAIYKVDVKGRGVRAKFIKPSHFHTIADEIEQDVRSGHIYKKLGIKTIPRRPKKKKKGGGKPVRSTYVPPVWLSVDSWQMVNISRELRPEKLVMTLDDTTVAQVFRQKKGVRNLAKILVWSLPPVILEEDLDFFEKAIQALLELGFYQFQIGHLSQVVLLGEIHDKVKLARQKRLVIFGGYTLNILNSLALLTLQKNGVLQTSVSMETDLDNLKLLAHNRGTSRLGMEVYGHPPLFTSRLQSEHLQPGKVLTSPRGEDIILSERGGQTVACAPEPYSIFGYVHELSKLGIDFMGMDVRGQKLKRRDMLALYSKLQRSTKVHTREKEHTFNFRLGLK
jgi:putative protease